MRSKIFKMFSLKNEINVLINDVKCKLPKFAKRKDKGDILNTSFGLSVFYSFSLLLC